MAEARASDAHEVLDRSTPNYAAGLKPVDLLFNTVGGAALSGSGHLVRPGGRIVSVAEQPPAGQDGIYFVVEPATRGRRYHLLCLLSAGDS